MVVYIQNRSPHTILGNLTSEEVFTCTKPVERETVRQDHQERDDEEEEHDAVPQEQNTRPRPKWYKSTVSDSRLAGLPERDFRRSKPPERLGYMALMTQLIDAEPSTYEQAAQHGVWQEAMMEEYASIMKNDVWEVVPRPEGKKVVGSKWIYKVKHAADGSVDKYKARFVAKGFSQREGVDYEETFAPVARYSSIRAVISLAAEKGWRVHQMDVKTAFLNRVVEEEVYVEQPEGFEVDSRETHVCRLRRALYGLKQAPRAWYSRIDSYLREMGFQRSEADLNLYFLAGEVPLILVLYVDDLFLTRDEQLIADCKVNLAAEFEMKDLGLMHYFLGLEVWQ
jgi:hypothetical protein